MTQKYLNALARALANCRPEAVEYAMMNQWLEDVDAVANVCQDSNPRLKRGLFIAACKTW